MEVRIPINGTRVQNILRTIILLCPPTHCAWLFCKDQVDCLNAITAWLRKVRNRPNSFSFNSSDPRVALSA